MKVQIIKECKRVCMMGGLIVFSYLNHWGCFMNELINNLKSLELLYREFASGNHEHIFYRSFPDEIDSLVRKAKLTKIKHISIDCFVYLAI